MLYNVLFSSAYFPLTFWNPSMLLHVAMVYYIFVWYSTEWIYCKLVIHSYVSEQFSHFQVVAIMINATYEHFCTFQINV